MKASRDGSAPSLSAPEQQYSNTTENHRETPNSCNLSCSQPQDRPASWSQTAVLMLRAARADKTFPLYACFQALACKPLSSSSMTWMWGRTWATSRLARACAWAASNQPTLPVFPSSASQLKERAPFSDSILPSQCPAATDLRKDIN